MTKKKPDNLRFLVERHFPKDAMLASVVDGKDEAKKGLALWALLLYHNKSCGVAYVFDAVASPGKVFYKYDSKRRMKYVDRNPNYEWAVRYYQSNNSRELFKN